ncbi:hypothetical protein EDD11_008512 [Mortierella claussenii]|nr:hypothetical protein EDD11_008512 [Mortierella claussenii]
MVKILVEYAKRAALANINILIDMGSILAAFDTLPQEFNDVVNPDNSNDLAEDEVADLEQLAQNNTQLLNEIANKIYDTDAIFWDEAPLLHWYAFEAVDRAVRDIMAVRDVLLVARPLSLGETFVKSCRLLSEGHSSRLKMRA